MNSVLLIIMNIQEKPDVNDYHMILDTFALGVENCPDILMHYFEKLEYI